MALDVRELVQQLAMAVVVALQVFKDTGIGHECVSLVRNRNNQVQCLFPKPINFQAEKNSSCPNFETGLRGEIGRASCRERVCQYVKISVVAVSLKKKKNK